MNHSRPLDGVVIVELGHSVAGPYAGLILADLGARVIKVENPKHGDYARDWGPPFWGDTSSSFASLNRGKESITVDFADPAEAAALRRLIIEQADGVIQNLRPGILDVYGLSAESFTRRKAFADLVRHWGIRGGRSDGEEARLRSSGAGLKRHHERDR
ncbi:crotonobetainyl-CoA:carnitine CoA-transferase CaiB-like acyl-CoA transferase [Bradyrhizobium sp. LM6.11]